MTRSGRLPPKAADARPRGGGIGRTSSEAAEAISDDLRRGGGPALDVRRRTAALLLGACATMGGVSLYQLGLLRHLPEPPLGVLDADRVDASGEAYKLGLTPDATLGLASYAASLALVGMGGKDRATERPWIPLLQTAKLGADAAGALLLSVEQGTKHKRFCSYCLAAAAASVAALVPALPEARTAFAALRS